MKQEKVYYSIRVVKAKNRKVAIQKISDQEFLESHNLCDMVMTERDLKRLINQQGGKP